MKLLTKEELQKMEDRDSVVILDYDTYRRLLLSARHSIVQDRQIEILKQVIAEQAEKLENK